MAESKYRFERLTPIDSVDLEVYGDAIDYVFKNSDVKNVAISGAYSAGKSSVLASYKKKHEDLCFLHISLAHFKSSEQKDEKGVNESILEGKILNQLIHQIPSDKIQQTNFTVKKTISPKNIINRTKETVLLLIVVIYFACFDIWKNYVHTLPDNWLKTVLSVFTHQYALLVDGLLIFILLSFAVYSLIKIQKNKNVFRKLNIQGNEIEIFEESDDSYFDKYLNEVLYLFENANADVIVFEDMDRFNANRIFERLREVNTLANIQLQKENKKVLRFFYLLRDDIFVSKDRTKFFDYIIPVVPVVDSSNAYDQFIAHFKNSELFEKFSESFLQGLSLYIDDMRLLKNIYNEFVIYYNRLNITELDCNKMLAIIAYKNLFPRDFADLQVNQGFAYTLFESKNIFISDEIERLDKQIFERRKEIESTKTNHLKTIDELNVVFARKYLGAYGWYSYDDNRLGNFVPEHLHGNNLKEYSDRKRQLENMLDVDIVQNEEEICCYEQEVLTVKNRRLHEIITRDNIGKIFSITSKNEIGEVANFNEIKSSEYFDLLKYLIRNGYIDETYADYMTYFYENSLSRIDKTFLRSITDKKAKEYTYQLQNPQLVISRLRLVDFEQEEALNLDLLEYLLLNDGISNNGKYLKTLITQIRERKNFEFVSKFFDTQKAHEQFIIRFNEQWPDLFSLILHGGAMSSSQIRGYSIDTLCYSDEKIIVAVNVDNCLTTYISKCSDYLAIEKPDIDKLISGFLLIKVSFASIDHEKANKALFDEVYRNSIYSLTFENISLMLKSKYEVNNDSDIIHKNYTLVQSRNHSPLVRYISENMPAYTEIILANCDNCISDDERVAISLLNNADIDLDTKNQYIKRLSTIIADITQVEEPDLWTTMMDVKIVAFSASNFINYFMKHGLNDLVISYINDGPSEVDFTSTSNVYGDDFSGKMFDEVAICNGIATDKYKKILCDLGYYFDNFDADKISGEKFKVLIDERILQMDADTLQFVRDKYEEQLYNYIRHNLDEYLALQTTELARLDEILQIIIWNTSDDKKIELLGYSNDSISIVGKQYSDAVNAYIITHNLNEEDKYHLYEHYDQYGEVAQMKIKSIALDGIEEIIANEMLVNDMLLSVLFQDDNVSQDQKITLFTKAIPRLNEDTCKTHLDELGLSELKGIFTKESGRRNYAKGIDITNVMEGFKSNHWIFDYHDDERNSDRYVIIKKRPRGKEPEFID
ncbi:MAG TPA: hypothetical protein DIC60_05775 [Lachnospiraceae bacterium]|nr:hypothetical protein [Lachnospiraceae bacterium]